VFPHSYEQAVPMLDHDIGHEEDPR
jgi:hypothetical protein